jgi:hypothetical protein
MLVKRAAFAAASFCIVNAGASQFRGRKVFPTGRTVSTMPTDDDADVGAYVVVTQGWLGYPPYDVREAARPNPGKSGRLETCYFFTSGHSLASSGLAESSGEIVAMVL